MTSLADFAAPREDVPKEWAPYAEQAGQLGSAVVKLPRPGATKRDLLVAAGFDPDEWSIKGEVQIRRWMRYDQEWLYYYKFSVTTEETAEHRKADIDALVKMLEKRKTAKPTSVPSGTDAFVVMLSDWQTGKGEGGGTTAMVDRVTAAVDKAVQRVKDLRRIGRAIPHGAAIGTGDLFEGTCGFYANQGYLIDANRREQGVIVRRLITYAIDELAPLFDTFDAATVGGNHGENRNEGKKVTDDADNDDVAAFECVREAMDRSGRPANVRWTIPHDELSIRLELGGVPVGFTHGHLFTSGGKLAQAKALEWWKGQAFGLQPVSDAKLLVSSHFHHLSVIDHGGRVHLQTPAMDGGSKWYRDISGQDAVTGMLTFRVSGDLPLGFADLEVL